MFKLKRKHKGVTLLELIIAMAIAMLLLLVLYYSYFLSNSVFDLGTYTVEVEHYVRNMFAKMSAELQYCNRLSAITGNQDSIEFEIFDQQSIQIDNNNNQLVQGVDVTYSTRDSTDDNGTSFLILQEYDQTYQWWMMFGHIETPNDNEVPFGYPDDMRDPTFGKTMTPDNDPDPNPFDIMDQEYEHEFLVQTAVFQPYDMNGLALNIGDSTDYSELENARSMQVSLTYLMSSGGGADSITSTISTKTSSIMIHFLAFVVLNGTQPGSATWMPDLDFSKAFCSSKFSLGFPSLNKLKLN